MTPSVSSGRPPNVSIFSKRLLGRLSYACPFLISKRLKNEWSQGHKVFTRTVRRYSQTSRDRPMSAPFPRLKAKGLPSVNLQYSKIEKPKNGSNGAPEPASASPWCAERGTLLKLSTFLSQLKGDPLEKKPIFQKKSHNAEKLKRGPFGILKHPICCETSKKLKGGFFGENFCSEKSLAVPKKIESLWSRSVWMLRGKIGEK